MSVEHPTTNKQISSKVDVENNLDTKLISKEVLSDWQNYLLMSRLSYLGDRRQSLGSEYFHSTSDWEHIFQREWAIIEERMNAGIGVDEDIQSLYGKDFFKNSAELLAEIDSSMELEIIEIEGKSPLTIYTFEDFIMLSNQGIFRDEIFLIDPQRKWKKKVREILIQYGYSTFENMVIRGEHYLVVTR
tara:strand:+ start:1218 stop:1781 length:564 start_codon:yes stop_codon:yes gene_type:complete